MRRLYTAITALFLATLLVSGVIVHAQATDPLSIADAYLAALNAGDVEAAVAFFADDAVRTSGPVQVTGKDEIRRDVERLVAMRVSVETVRIVAALPARYTGRRGRRASGGGVGWGR